MNANAPLNPDTRTCPAAGVSTVTTSVAFGVIRSNVVMVLTVSPSVPMNETARSRRRPSRSSR